MQNSRNPLSRVFAGFLPAAEQVYTLALFRQSTNSLFGQHWKHWFLVTSVTTCEKCDHMWHMRPHVTSVTTCDNCDHMWKVWPHVTSVTTSWTFGHHRHLDIMDIWTFGHNKKHIWKFFLLNIWNIVGRRYLRTFPSCYSLSFPHFSNQMYGMELLTDISSSGHRKAILEMRKAFETLSKVSDPNPK